MSDLKIMREPKKNTLSRFIIGIDLGTTNCALAFIDTLANRETPEIMAIPQWESTDAIHSSPSLPSFYYLPPKNEWKRGQLNVPFMEKGSVDEAQDYAVGRYASYQAGVAPDRVIHSAKSWLCHPGVDRDAPILPWHSDDIVGSARRSPIDVSAAYLRHLACAWNARFAKDSEEYQVRNQDVVITVPASFDEVAQELTLEAAKRAGFNPDRIRLLEEPQAAFYHWLAHASQVGGGLAAALLERMPSLRRRAQTVLICDVGGGTTDFSLFEVAAIEDDVDKPAIRRLAVSEHLLLGGDNIDIALAHRLEQRLNLPEKQLSSRQWVQLIAQARNLKESALSDQPDADDQRKLHASVANEGAALFASTMSTHLTAGEVKELIVSGYLPPCGSDERPERKPMGLMEFGLPYATDSAITRHLAAFLSGRSIDAILFTGGTLKPKLMRQQVLNVVTSWQSEPVVVLDNDHMDLAVALGAAFFGGLTISSATRISGGYPRSVYAEVTSTSSDLGQRQAICIIPKGAEPGETIVVDQLALKTFTEEPVRFQLFTSASRPDDKVGDLVTVGVDEFHPLAPLDTKLIRKSKKSEKVTVHLEALVTETGILELYCVHRDERWKLQFNLRGLNMHAVSRPATDAKTDQEDKGIEAARRTIERWLNELYGAGKAKAAQLQPRMLVRNIEELTGRPRDDIDIAMLRELWPVLKKGLTRRSRSVAHEVTWLSLAGLSLRPGYGFPLDEWRVAELWRCYDLGMAHPHERQVEEQWWIMWRRVAGGLERWQQEKIFDKLFPSVRKGETSSVESYLLMGSLERVNIDKKIKLGNALVQQLRAGKKSFTSEKLWALARLSSRTPLYCGPEAIIRPSVVESWLHGLKDFNGNDRFYKRLPLVYAQVGRIVDDREFDLSESVRLDLIKRMRACGSPEAWITPLQKYTPLDREARDRLFGETLPSGLMID